jgi:hypothetical protein
MNFSASPHTSAAKKGHHACIQEIWSKYYPQLNEFSNKEKGGIGSDRRKGKMLATDIADRLGRHNTVLLSIDCFWVWLFTGLAYSCGLWTSASFCMVSSISTEMEFLIEVHTIASGH